MILMWLACADIPKDTATETGINVSGQVVALFGGSGIPEVQVCLLEDQTLCSVTDDDGHYELAAVPASQELSLLLDGAELVGGVLPFVSGPQDTAVAKVSLLAPAIIEGQFAALERSWTSGTGLLAFSVSNGIDGDGINIPGVVAAMTPASGEGPFYSNSLGLPGQDLASTSDNGGGVLINISPGDYTLSYENLPEGCDRLIGWGDPQGHRLPVLAERVSFLRLVCAAE